MKRLWTIYLVWACLAGAYGLSSYVGAQSAPQQAAAACMALAATVIPYLLVQAGLGIESAKAADAERLQRNVEAAKAKNPDSSEVDPDKLRRIASRG